jgi:VCBS repeat-containing protein
MAANGDWVYDADEANGDVLAPAAGDTLEDVVSVQSEDGTSEDITITITGVNDAATFGGDLTGGINEDGDTVGGTATVADVDTGEGSFTADSIDGTYGELTIDASGNWVYTIDNSESDVQGLAAGDTIADTITVTSDDGTEQDIVVTITGVNDAATIGGTLTGDIDANGDTVGGTATSTDVDGNDDVFQVDTIEGSYGDLTMAANGDWVYDVDEANGDVLALAAGDTLEDVVSVQSEDGTSEDVTITITGVNDAATFGGDLTGGINEDDDTVGGTATVADVDTGEGSFTADSIDGTYGELTIDAGGDWVYTIDNGDSVIQALAAGDTIADTVTVSSDDGTEQDIVVTITGTNDAPTSSGGDRIHDEDTTVTFTAADFGFSDVDTGDTLASIRIDSLPSGGGLRLSGANVAVNDVILVSQIPNLTYTPAGNFNGVRTFTYSVNDGIDYAASPATMRITTEATNDAPAQPTLIGTTTVQENVKGAVFGEIRARDADSSVVNLTVDDDRFMITGGDILKLKPGVSLDFEEASSITINVTATDGSGASSSRAFVITVTDVNEQVANDSGDTLEGSDAEDDIRGGKGNDKISSGNGKDTIDGGEGNDDIGGGDDDDLLTGGEGDDTVDGGNGEDTLRGGEGNDNVIAGFGDDLIFAGIGDLGNDIVSGGGGFDTLGGGAGNDLLMGEDNDDLLWGRFGADTVDGGTGNDMLYNGQGDDTVVGGDGNDTLWAGNDDDLLSGGDGEDVFMFGHVSGNDTIQDFDINEDQLNLQFSGAGFSNLADVQAASSLVTQDGNTGVLIDLGNGQSAFLVGLSLGDLTSVDFVL